MIGTSPFASAFLVLVISEVKNFVWHQVPTSPPEYDSDPYGYEADYYYEEGVEVIIASWTEQLSSLYSVVSLLVASATFICVCICRREKPAKKGKIIKVK